MRLVNDIAEVRTICREQRRAGRTVGLVPTMGYLHEGHTALVEKACELADFVVVSIFVNPTQFGPDEDLDSYPRDMEGDLAKCREAGAALVFLPPADQIYPEGYQTYVTVERLSQGLCGASRPVHFRGVATVVTKLFCIVGPCVAVFGQKDYQQLQVVTRLARDLHLEVEVVGHPTVREPDGLAKSSRNAYLSDAERRAAPCLYAALSEVKRLADDAGTLGTDRALAAARTIIEAAPGTRIDYIEVRDAGTLEPTDQLGGGNAVMALAVHLGKARLIDNMVV